MKGKTPKYKISSARSKRLIEARANDFASKAKVNFLPGGNRNLSEFYSGAVHGMTICCNILNLNSDKMNLLLKELSEM